MLSSGVKCLSGTDSKAGIEGYISYVYFREISARGFIAIQRSLKLWSPITCMVLLFWELLGAMENSGFGAGSQMSSESSLKPEKKGIGIIKIPAFGCNIFSHFK